MRACSGVLLLAIVPLAIVLAAPTPARAAADGGLEIGMSLGGAAGLTFDAPGGFRLQTRFGAGPLDGLAFDGQLNLTVGGSSYGIYCDAPGTPGRRCYNYDDRFYAPYGRGDRGTGIELMFGVRRGFQSRMQRLVPYVGVLGGPVFVNWRYSYGDAIGFGIRPNGGLQVRIGAGFVGSFGIGLTVGPVFVECGSGCRETDVYAVLDFLFGIGFRF